MDTEENRTYQSKFSRRSNLVSIKSYPTEQDQSWYFVLVDGKQQVTYVAEENLKHDRSGIEITHPMLDLFFSGYDPKLKRYIRNEVPWNPGDPPDVPPPLPPPNFKPSSPPSF